MVRVIRQISSAILTLNNILIFANCNLRVIQPKVMFFKYMQCIQDIQYNRIGLIQKWFKTCS